MQCCSCNLCECTATQKNHISSRLINVRLSFSSFFNCTLGLKRTRTLKISLTDTSSLNSCPIALKESLKMPKSPSLMECPFFKNSGSSCKKDSSTATTSVAVKVQLLLISSASALIVITVLQMGAA